MSKQDTVLIVGSGPTGMIVAAQLAMYGLPVRLIDKLSQPSTTSRAFTIHARTLELLAQMGLADAFLDKSIKTYSMDYHFPMKEEVPKLDFRALDSVYPFCLTINQADTETILRDYLDQLGVKIEWQRELVSFEETENGRFHITLNHTDTQQTEQLTTDWLIGCDGVRSVVRQQMNVALDGSDYGGTMRMMDVPMTGFDYTDEAIHYFIAKDHMLLVNKLPGANHRVLISDKTEGVPPEEARDAFQATLNQHFSGRVTLGDPVWSTNFRISKRKVNSFRQGRIFLAGDSAHVNSPAGGQGMNVAMQDGFNLGWKLAMVINGTAPANLLDSYETERNPVAHQMLEGTNYIHSIIMAHGKGMAERIERMKGGAWNAEAVNQIAGISYTYRSEEETAPLAVGDRAPDALLANGKRIYEQFSLTGYTLLIFAGESPTEQQMQQGQTMAEAAQQATAVPLTAHIITDANFHTRYHSQAGQQILVRPDCHLAYIGDDVLSYLKQTMG